MKPILAIILLASFLVSDAVKGKELPVGSTAPEWAVENWANSEALKLGDLRGKVVLIRFWTSQECPFCSATAPALNEFNELYKDKGLQVIGLYTHKRKTPFTEAEFKDIAAEYGFKFPIAHDTGMQTLRQWWLAGERKKFTSVSFLIDKKGVIQFIHSGGKYVKGDADYSAIKSKIEELLDEK